MNKNVLSLLETTRDRFPDKPAFSDSEGSLSYDEAVQCARSIGSAFNPVYGQHRAIAVMIKKSKEMLTCFFGIVYSGNFYIPIDTEMPTDRVQKIFSCVDPYAIITNEECLEKAKEAAAGSETEIFLYSDLIRTPVDVSGLNAVRCKSIDTDPVYALFTSGSTGIPKGVVCCHRSVIDYADWLTDTFHFDENTIFGSQTPFYFSMSVLDIYATIRSGAELHVIPQKLFAFPAKLLEYINERKINAIYWVPTALCIVANMKALDEQELPYLKTILFAGEAMPNKQLNIWRKHLPNALYANLFGPTEITDIGIYYVVDREFADDEPLPIGIACDNVDYMILDPSNHPVKTGEIGELCIRGSFLSLGYYDDPEKTNSVFIQNPLNPHYPELIYKTGDLVSLNEYGELMYHGRADFQIKHRGNRIELGEIENAASSTPNVTMCAVTYDKVKEKIVLFYSGEATKKEIRSHMQDKVPEYMLPNVMMPLEELPKNQNGKIDRKALMAIYNAR